MAGSKKVHTKSVKEDPGGNPYYAEQTYFPSALIGKALGLHPKYPKPNREVKRDKPAGVGMADIREKYRRKGND